MTLRTYSHKRMITSLNWSRLLATIWELCRYSFGKLLLRALLYGYSCWSPSIRETLSPWRVGRLALSQAQLCSTFLVREFSLKQCSGSKLVCEVRVFPPNLFHAGYRPVSFLPALSSRLAESPLQEGAGRHFAYDGSSVQKTLQKKWKRTVTFASNSKKDGPDCPLPKSYSLDICMQWFSLQQLPDPL